MIIYIILYLYNIKTNKTRVSQIDNNTTSHLSIKFNTDNDIYQFEDQNKYIDLPIINIIRQPIFTTRNNATIKVTIVKIGNRYYIFKPSKECLNNNINAINEINTNKIKNYKLTDVIKKELILSP